MTQHDGSSYHYILMDTSSGVSGATNAISIAKALLVGVRPRQWYKNLIIYLAFFFTINEAWSLNADIGAALAILGELTLAFLIFSALTGAVYLVNDILDADGDRLHPHKRHRPIASGRLPVPAAWTGAAALSVVGIGFAFALEPMFGVVAGAYALLQVAYSLFLKHIALVDVFAISGGIVLRAVAGAVILQVPISPWLYLCTALAALLLALIKRRSQLAAAGEDAASQRPALSQYTIASLDRLINITATASFIAYSLYTFTAPNLPANDAMMLTIPFVAFGLLRYLMLTDSAGVGENPEDLLIGDRPLTVTLILWLTSAAIILALFRS